MTKGQYTRVNKNRTTNQLPSICINDINKGLLINDSMTFVIHEYQQSIKLDKTRCYYGGFRYWFLCPACEKRVAILYLGKGKFLCRHCQQLVYVSQRESETDRLLYNLWKIRKMLGEPNSIDTLITSKPNGMHWETFGRLKRMEREAGQKYASAVIKRFRLDIP